MSKIEMKVGEWYEQGNGIRWHCLAEIPADSSTPFVCYNYDGDCVTVTDHGMYYTDGSDSVMDLVRHLPGCTGFDWQEPKFKVGDVVYATKPKENNMPGISWVVPMDRYEGKPFTVKTVSKEGWVQFESDRYWYFHPDWLSKEPPAAQYRPFANDEEYAPHFDRKVLRDSKASPGAKGQYRICAFDHLQVWTSDHVQCTYEKMFKDGRKFADTNEPFGVKIS